MGKAPSNIKTEAASRMLLILLLELAVVIASRGWQTRSYTVTVSIASGFVSIGFQIDTDNSAKLKPYMAEGLQSSLWATSEPYNRLRFLSSLSPHTDQLGHIRCLGTQWADEKTRIRIWSPPSSLLFYLPECFIPLRNETKYPVCLKFS